MQLPQDHHWGNRPSTPYGPEKPESIPQSSTHGSNDEAADSHQPDGGIEPSDGLAAPADTAIGFSNNPNNPFLTSLEGATLSSVNRCRISGTMTKRCNPSHYSVASKRRRLVAIREALDSMSSVALPGPAGGGTEIFQPSGNRRSPMPIPPTPTPSHKRTNVSNTTDYGSSHDQIVISPTPSPALQGGHKETHFPMLTQGQWKGISGNRNEVQVSRRREVGTQTDSVCILSCPTTAGSLGYEALTSSAFQQMSPVIRMSNNSFNSGYRASETSPQSSRLVVWVENSDDEDAPEGYKRLQNYPELNEDNSHAALSTTPIRRVSSPTTSTSRPSIDMFN